MKTDKYDWLVEAAKTNEAWAKELEITLTESQKAELSAIKDGRSFNVLELGHGEGKTFLTAFLMLRLVLTHPYSLALVLCPTMNQARDIWLLQCEKLAGRSERISKMITFTPRGFIVLGEPSYQWGCLLASGDEKIERIMGIMRNHLFIVVDEAAGIPDEHARVVRAYGTHNSTTRVFVTGGS